VPSLCAILIALVTSLGITQAAYGGTITIEWDRSPDPTVAGYRVSVGTAPGAYTETFDVGSATSFVYQAQDTRLYYLAVASYAEGPLRAASGYPEGTPGAAQATQRLLSSPGIVNNQDDVLPAEHVKLMALVP
jgi:hypothetical protein